MKDYSHLKLDAHGNPTDRLHLMCNREQYIEYWMSLPFPKLTLMERIKKFFRNLKGD